MIRPQDNRKVKKKVGREMEQEDEQGCDQRDGAGWWAGRMSKEMRGKAIRKVSTEMKRVGEQEGEQVDEQRAERLAGM